MDSSRHADIPVPIWVYQRIGDHALIEKVARSQLATITCPLSRFYCHLPRTLIDLNSSMSALACCRQWSIDLGTITGC